MITHRPAARYETCEAPEARRLSKRLEVSLLTRKADSLPLDGERSRFYHRSRGTRGTQPHCIFNRLGLVDDRQIHSFSRAARQHILAFRFDFPRDIRLDRLDVEAFQQIADAAYVVDLGGNLYRIDFINQTTKAALAPGAWTMTKIAHTQSSRKIMFAPSVLPAADRVFVTFGSGDRERPLSTNYPYTKPVVNRFFMFMDRFTAGSDADLDSATMGDITASALSPCLSPSSTLSGWRMDLIGGDAANRQQGEQTVTSSLIAGGKVFFNTNRPVAPAAGQCSSSLGEARGYNASLLCGADRFSVVFQGGGLPITPVQGTVTLPLPGGGNEVVTFVIGGPVTDPGGGLFAPGQPKPAVSPKRSRIYWYRHGDK